MATQSSSLMARRSALNDGFTMLEMMLTLSIISILLLISAASIPVDDDRRINQEIDAIGYFFQSAQTDAMSTATQRIVSMDPISQQIQVRTHEGKIIRTYLLDTCALKQGGLQRIIFKPDGDTDKFGTISFDCMGSSVSFIFQIQRGRFRIER
ncbi:prepilin-type N-terminal cleavage/methylation domain-containing protein [Salinicoccus sp. ID82-1]|uniref:prepilin-type N-terminal cleavage/methylation domain-containing protein n=1 Tax=Salinicoccus sp. ID82-1 TaxID=2820269 RepID=UPI001F2D28EF|nr:prepilin-type N-terminal cleavage/methylation domain-containing protein [Salinicoccus sp. ID82-1]MCG1009021.1 prepilin-type N-terminal cleavage/methylation domain-containing protein [Salinicoccus sp. ID82-1]